METSGGVERLRGGYSTGANISQFPGPSHRERSRSHETADIGRSAPRQCFRARRRCRAPASRAISCARQPVAMSRTTRRPSRAARPEGAGLLEARQRRDRLAQPPRAQVDALQHALRQLLRAGPTVQPAAAAALGRLLATTSVASGTNSRRRCGSAIRRLAFSLAQVVALDRVAAVGVVLPAAARPARGPRRPAPPLRSGARSARSPRARRRPGSPAPRGAARARAVRASTDRATPPAPAAGAPRAWQCGTNSSGSKGPQRDVELAQQRRLAGHRPPARPAPPPCAATGRRSPACRAR